MESNTVDVEGIRMRWEERGTGPPVVLVHGIPTSPALWRHVAPKLDARVLAWEMVGYGQSIPEGKGRDISVATQAAHLLAWLDAIGVDQPVLVGHDDRDVAKDSLDIHVRPYLEHGGADAMVRQVHALDVADTEAIADQLPALDLPSRIVWGDADQFQKLEYGERLARDLRAPLHRIPGGKHFTPEDHPDIIAEEIEALLATVRERRP